MSSERAVPSPQELFWAYLVLGASSFGGSIVWMRYMLVEQRRWLTADEFNDALSISQFLPGPNVFNLIVVLGPRFGGAKGIVASTLGIMALPFVFAIGIGALYSLYGDQPAAKAAMRGVAPIAAGLMLALGFKVALSPTLRSVLALFAVATFIAVAYFRVSLLGVLVTLAPLAIFVAWRRLS